MSIIESKSIKVAPALEQEIIDKHEMFGWTLTNSQEIHSQVGQHDSIGGIKTMQSAYAG